VGFGRGKGFSPVAPAAPSEERVYLGTRSNRTLGSTHSSWATAWTGALATKLGVYLPNYYFVSASVYESVTWWIRRGFLFFDTSDLPLTAVITAAKLGLYVVSHTTPAGINLYITQGIQGDPVLPADFAAQNTYDTILGEKLYSALVDNQYNDIDLNAAGIALINAAGAIHRQFESYDEGENSDFNDYGVNWWCQSFTPAVAHKITSVKFKMWRSGSPGTITVEIKAADASHFPTGAALCSGTFDGNTLTTSTPGAWYEITLGAGADLSEGVEYTVEIKATGGDATNLIKLRGNSAGVYLGGGAAYTLNSGGSWTAQTGYDIYFIEYDTGLASTKGTMLCLRNTSDVANTEPPSGYDARCDFHSGQKGDLYAPKLTITYHL